MNAPAAAAAAAATGNARPPSAAYVVYSSILRPHVTPSRPWWNCIYVVSYFVSRGRTDRGPQIAPSAYLLDTDAQGC